MNQSLIAGGCILALVLAACRQENPAPQTHHEEHEEHHDEVVLSADAIKDIAVEPAQKRLLTPTLSAPARVTLNADAVAHISSVVRGRVVDLKVKQNAVVQKGDELLVIDSPELGEAQSDYLQKRTGVQTAISAQELHAGMYQRMKGLFDQTRSFSHTELEERELLLKNAEGAATTAQAALTAARSKLSLAGMSEEEIKQLSDSGHLLPRHVVHAPISGTVLERETTLGEYVTPERESLLILASLETLWVMADVPEAKLHLVSPGAPVMLKVPGEGPGGEIELRGKITLIDIAIDPLTRSGRARIDMPGEHIRPGMFVRAEIDLLQPGAQSQVVVPVEAVQTVEGEPSVFVPVEGEERTFAKRAVRVGKAIGAWRPVLAGLEEGESFVTRGSFLLKAEMGKGEAEHVH